MEENKVIFNMTFFGDSIANQNSVSKNRTIVFRQINDKDVNVVLKSGFPHHKTRLIQLRIDNAIQKFGLKPQNMGLVAYHAI